MDPQQIMQMVQQLMQAPSNAPAGAAPTQTPSGGVPPQIQEDDPMMRLMQQLQMMLSQQQGMNTGINSQRAMNGQQGAASGGMGGRPPAGSVPPSALR